MMALTEENREPGTWTSLGKSIDSAGKRAFYKIPQFEGDLLKTNEESREILQFFVWWRQLCGAIILACLRRITFKLVKFTTFKEELGFQCVDGFSLSGACEKLKRPSKGRLCDVGC